MFEHSVKVPRHYKIASNIFKKVSVEGGSVKTLLYDDKLRHFRTNVLYALITETIKHSADIDKIFEHSKLLENEPRLDPWLAKILTAELLFGKKALPGKSKPEQTILSYKDKFDKYATDHQDDLKTEVTRRPRYVRVNTNLLTTSDAIRAFQDEGYRFIRCTSGSYNDYLTQIQNLTEDDFTQDYHVKTMFVFSAGTKLHQHELYLEDKIILQDKATAMAVHLLAPPPGSVVLDMCAAPGMKTTQLAAYLRNEGKIYAVERNEKRYQTLVDFVSKTGSKCVETIQKDALEIRRGDYDDVEYILLDPSCSGSGMELCVHNYIEETRLAKLTSLQEKFLKHAMNAFPKAKRIVYSTCSLFPEENERVITNVVKTSRAKWRVQDVKDLLKEQWNNFGSGMYGSMGTRCMYAKPDSDHTIGFFLAVLDRDQKHLEKAQKVNDAGNENTNKTTDNEDVCESNQKSKSKSKKVVDVIHEVVKDNVNEADNFESNEEPIKKKNKKNKNVQLNTPSTSENISYKITEQQHSKKKRKKDKTHDFDKSNVKENEDDNTVESEEIPKKKKKIKHKTQNIPENVNFPVENPESKLSSLELDDGLNIKKKKEKVKKSDEIIDKKKKLRVNDIEAEDANHNSFIEGSVHKKKKKVNIDDS